MTNLLTNPYFGKPPNKPSLIGWSQDKGYWEADHKPSNLGPFATSVRMADAQGPGGGSFPYNDEGSIWQVVGPLPAHASVDIGVRQIQHEMPVLSNVTYMRKLLYGSHDQVNWQIVTRVDVIDSHDVRQADDWSNVTYSTPNLPKGGYPYYKFMLVGRIASSDVNSNVKIAEVHLVIDSKVQFYENL